MKNEDESLETRGQRPIKFVRNSGYGAEFLKKGESNDSLFYLWKLQRWENVLENFFINASFRLIKIKRVLLNI